MPPAFRFCHKSEGRIESGQVQKREKEGPGRESANASIITVVRLLADFRGQERRTDN